MLPWESLQYRLKAMFHCLRFEIHCTRLAFSFALAKAGSSMAAKMAMMAMTTSNSISVKPEDDCLAFCNMGIFDGRYESRLPVPAFLRFSGFGTQRQQAFVISDIFMLSSVQKHQAGRSRSQALIPHMFVR